MDEHPDRSPEDGIELEVSDLRQGVTGDAGRIKRAPPRFGAAADAHPARPPWRRLASVAAALTLAVAALLYGIHAGAFTRGESAAVTPTVQTGHLIATRMPDLAGIACLRDAAWSPDSAAFAYVGSTDPGCGFAAYVPNVVNIYRTRDGSLIRQLHPDAAVFAALKLPRPPGTPSAPRSASLFYNGLLWSKDGTQLAALFYFLPGGGTANHAGVVLLRPDGTGVRVIVVRETDALQRAAYVTWDLATGGARPGGKFLFTSESGPPLISPLILPLDLPPALSYHWTADGRIEPDGTLSAAAPPAQWPTDSISSPDGMPYFDIWQSGQIGYVTADKPPPTTSIYAFGTSFHAWSPDGRYLAFNLGSGGRLQPSDEPRPSQDALARAQLDRLPLLPMRDAGLAVALRLGLTDPQLASGASEGYAYVAWSPGGAQVALFTQAHGFAIFGSADGRTQVPLSFVEQRPSSGIGRLLWSPDGRWLLLPDGALLRAAAQHV